MYLNNQAAVIGLTFRKFGAFLNFIVFNYFVANCK